MNENKTKLEIAKEVIQKNLDDARCGIFNCRNWVGDTMTTIYQNGGLTIDICYGYEYFEVFGLTVEDFNELSHFYNKLNEEEED